MGGGLWSEIGESGFAVYSKSRPKSNDCALDCLMQTLVTFSVLSAGNSHITAVVRDSCLQIGMV